MVISKIFLIIFLAGILHCGSTLQQASRDKHTFFSPSIKDGYDFIRSQGLELRKIDTVYDKSGKVYIFYYRYITE